MDHDPDRHDDRAIALALAALALVENPSTGEAGTIFSDLKAMPRRGFGGLTTLAATPWRTSPWDRWRPR
jgi:hypothetical protein